MVKTQGLVSKRIRDIVIGAIAGYVTNYLWQRYQLFGYNQTVFTVDALSFAQDDLIEIVIGIIIYLKFNKNMGLGFVLAILGTKVWEAYGSALTTVATASKTISPPVGV